MTIFVCLMASNKAAYYVLLFCVYIDELLLKLSATGVGCYMGFTFVGGLAYANDFVLNCPTPCDLLKL